MKRARKPVQREIRPFSQISKSEKERVRERILALLRAAERAGHTTSPVSRIRADIFNELGVIIYGTPILTLANKHGLFMDSAVGRDRRKVGALRRRFSRKGLRAYAALRPEEKARVEARVRELAVSRPKLREIVRRVREELSINVSETTVQSILDFYKP